MKLKLRKCFALLKAVHVARGFVKKVIKKGGYFEKLGNGKLVRWYCWESEDGKIEYTPEFKISGLSVNDVKSFAPENYCVE